MDLLNGKVEEVAPQLAASSFDAVLCDPPYGLSSAEKRNMRRMSPRASSRGVASGFMGMEWDAKIPGPEVWAAILRLMKPGAPLIVFGGTRTFHRLACAIEDAGFLLADTICWLHGQGFPKGRAQLKPGWEPITLAWKKGKRPPLAIDSCRIPAGDVAYARNCSGDRGHDQNRKRRMAFNQAAGSASLIGRWPANVLLDETAAELLDQQSGTRHSDKTRHVLGKFNGHECPPGWKNDTGGASRFFYCAKAGKKERGDGNTHPTVKPLKLTEYLARLILPPERGTARRILIPFAGSGSEMIGALRAGWDEVTGIEMNADYCRINRRRTSREQAASATAAA